MPNAKLTTTVALGSFAVLGLAGCAAQTPGTGASTAAPDPQTSTTAAGPSASSSTTAAASPFKDGDYSATGQYDSPGGSSAIGVDLTLKGGVVTAVKVVPKADNPTAASYEAKFASGVGPLVVGKKITDLKVTTVSGSSLTSQGFDKAVTAIETEARGVTAAVASPWTFEAIGTVWRVTAADPVDPRIRQAVLDRIRRYDEAFSRFRPDSLVAQHSQQGGSMRYPAEAAALFALYDRVGALTEGRVTPLVGGSLERLGYDAAYGLRPTGDPLAPPPSTAMDVRGSTVTLQQPALLDVGAAGKGQLVDLVAGLLAAHGHHEVTVDAGGDVRHAGAGLRVGLEHPHDPTAAIGVVTLAGDRCAIAGSATNRRRWGDGWHHILDGTTGAPVRSVVATWALASAAMVADLLATALFFVPGARIEQDFDADWVRVFADGRFEASAGLPGELFTS